MSTVFGAKHEVSDLADDLVVRASDFRTDDLVRPQARCKLVDVDERPSAFRVAPAQRCPALHLRLSRQALLLSLILVVVYQRQNWWRQRGFRFPDALASDSLEGWLPPVTST